MLEIRNQDQQDFVVNKLTKISSQASWWLNLRRKKQNPCVFYWPSTNSDPIYTAWATGKPMGPTGGTYTDSRVCNDLGGWDHVYMDSSDNFSWRLGPKNPNGNSLFTNKYKDIRAICQLFPE